MQRAWQCAPQLPAGTASEEPDLSFQCLISLQNDEYGVPLPEEDFKPKGPSWLYHSDAIRTYLSLMDHSKKDATLEACAGALQNLTASRGLVSTPLHTCGQTCQHLTVVRSRNGLLQPQGSIAGLSTLDDAAQVLINAKDESLQRLKSALQGFILGPCALPGAPPGFSI